MIGELQCVVLDCADVVVLSRFYAALLGGEVNRPDPRWAVGDDWATLHTGAGQVLAFQRVDDHRPPRWPDPAHPAQAHLDIDVPDLERAQAEVLARGATLLDAGEAARGWRVFADPAGHPFCLLRRPAANSCTLQ
ncbi:VOC family protein [Streptomyces sp. SID5785]|uniref:VOC family protein n=1 Tax=Streptomyces sp. SID5785 TaxID=2690309 RepID=UPI00136159ED|nr:VOC family protein [Streptomyces sp. SID5785]MZD06648.1 VOC family protein [Streptomyces sp. SID5785]